MAIEKIDHENQVYEDFLHLRLETKNDRSVNENDFWTVRLVIYSFAGG